MASLGRPTFLSHFELSLNQQSSILESGLLSFTLTWLWSHVWTIQVRAGSSLPTEYFNPCQLLVAFLMIGINKIPLNLVIDEELRDPISGENTSFCNGVFKVEYGS